MSNNSETALIRDQSPEATDGTETSSKNQQHNTDNGNVLNVQSIVLDKLLADPEMQEVVVMEVSIANCIKKIFSNFDNCSTRNYRQLNYFKNYDLQLKSKATAYYPIGWLLLCVICR